MGLPDRASALACARPRRSGRLRPDPARLLGVLLASLAAFGALPGRASANDATGPSTLLTALRAGPAERVTFSVANVGPDVVTISLRDSPFDPFQPAASLTVDRPSKGWSPLAPVRYVGRLAKRLPPGPDELVELAPGERIETTVSLADRFDVAAAGGHRVALAHPLLAASGTRTSIIARSSARAGRLDAGFEPVRVPPAVSVALSPLGDAATTGALTRLRPPAFELCSERQREAIVDAATLAETLTVAALADLDALAPDERALSPRYRTWFGRYDADRFADVRADISAVGSAIAERRLAFDCSCDEAGVYAYVYPSRPYDIYLCPVFWATSLDGADSRAGTLVHELSHFDAIASTHDHVYTQARARSLALTDPSLAIDNADSFEYFIENSPPVPLRAEPGDAPDASPGATATVDDELAVAGDERVALAFGTPSRGVLGEGEARRFAVDGARDVRLESIGGDADLYIFDGVRPDAERLLCASVLTPDVSTVDRCEVRGDGAMTAIVFGYTATEFVLTVDGPVDDGVTSASGSAENELSSGSGALSLWWLTVGIVAGARRAVHGARCCAAAGAALTVIACSAAPAGNDGGSTVRASGDERLRLDLAVRRAADGTTLLRVALRNRKDVPVVIDATQTPFETPLSADVFEVLREEEPVRYLGRLVKRTGGRSSDTFELAPDEQRVAWIDLGAHYALTPGRRHSVSPRRIVRGGVVRLAGLPDVSPYPPGGVPFVP